MTDQGNNSTFPSPRSKQFHVPQSQLHASSVLTLKLAVFRLLVLTNLNTNFHIFPTKWPFCITSQCWACSSSNADFIGWFAEIQLCSKTSTSGCKEMQRAPNAASRKRWKERKKYSMTCQPFKVENGNGLGVYNARGSCMSSREKSQNISSYETTAKCSTWRELPKSSHRWFEAGQGGWH